MTPFIGVRISWLMRARNSLLALLARSAASLARVASPMASFSSRLALPRLIGAFLDLLLEELTVFLQARVAMPNLPQHLIETVDQRTDLVLRTTLDPQRVVFLRGYALHGVRQIDDGPGDLLLQRCGQPIRRQHGGEYRRQCDEQVAAPILVQRLQRHADADEPQNLPLRERLP